MLVFVACASGGGDCVMYVFASVCLRSRMMPTIACSLRCSFSLSLSLCVCVFLSREYALVLECFLCGVCALAGPRRYRVSFCCLCVAHVSVQVP